MFNDEAQLVQRARHDPEAFALLYDRYVERIFAYAQRETGDSATAEDIVAATFEKALKNLPRYEWRGTTFGAWLYQIARNEIRMIWRKEKGVLPLIGRFFSRDNVEQSVLAQDERDEIRAALRRLPARDQEILRLAYYEALSHAEIGEVLNCSSRNVAVRLHRALKRLRAQMASDAPEAGAEMIAEVKYDVSSN